MIGFFNAEGEPISVQEWGALMESRDYRIVKVTEINGIVVSTVWLGLDHNFIGDGPPLIFETMVFRPGERGGELIYRYTTHEQAERGHETALLRLLETMTKHQQAGD